MHFNYSVRTIQRLRAHNQQTRTVTDRPRSGRLRKTTAVVDRYIVTYSKRNRLWTCRMIAARLMNATQTRFSVSTFLNLLRSAGLKARRPCVWVPLTVRHRRLRLNWARGHYCCSRRRWNRVLFMDESRLNVQFADRRLGVWRRTGERMDENNIVERDRYGGGSVMIWGGICHCGKTELVTVNGRLNASQYCDEIIIPIVIHVLQGERADLLQQDNARCHVARRSLFSPFKGKQHSDTRLTSACE